MLLSAEHISLSFGLKQLLDDVTLYLNEGDKIGIIGINGTGKSSFLRVLAGQQVPDSGTVSRDPNVQVCFLSQNPKMDPEATVLEQVFSDFSPDTRALMEYEAKAMLTRLGITDFAQPVGTLSGGQRKRVALAAVLLHPADVLILDEPTNHLDSDMVIWLEDRLRKFNGGLIMVTHDLGVIATMCDEIIVMYGGRVCERGTADEIFYNPSHEYTKGLLRSIPSAERMKERLVPIAGNPINLLNMPAGCAFCTRCDKAMKVCLDYVPMERQVAQDHLASCWLNDLALKDKAAEMAAAGESAEAVQLATGWVKNEGGEWVFDPIVAEEGGADDEQ